MRPFAVRTLVAAFVFAAGGAGLLAQGVPAKATLTPVVERATVAPGSDVRVALQVHLPDGYHMNSNAPRDPMLIPVRLTVSETAGVSVRETVFPPPTDLTQRGAQQPLSVFEKDFVIGAVLHLDPSVPTGSLSVPLTLRYQACDETMCYIPTRAEATWDLVVGSPSSAPSHPDVFNRIAFGSGQAPATASPATATTSAAAPSTSGARDGSAEVAALQQFTEQGTTFGYLGTSDFLTFVHNAEQGVRTTGTLEGRGPLAILLLVLLGGLALNLTPCVLPMVPINLAIIGAGAQADSRHRGFLLGATYGAAMALVYGVLGLVVVLTASSFGTINANPWFNAGIAVLFVVLGLAMFDVVNIDFSRFSGGFRAGGSRGSFIAAFTMGGISALLAGACVAPVVIQVVVFSSDLYARGTTAALALPFVLGLGMALPWPLAGAGVSALPRAGAWMTRIKQAFGVIIIGTALYYGYEAYGLFASRAVDASEVASSVEAKLKEGWQPSLVDGLAQATRERKPVLVDMWATWCKNCLVMDRTTLEDPAVKQALSGYIKVKFQAEDPDDPRVAAVMRYVKTSGLPTYVILTPKP